MIKLSKTVGKRLGQGDDCVSCGLSRKECRRLYRRFGDRCCKQCSHKKKTFINDESVGESILNQDTGPAELSSRLVVTIPRDINVRGENMFTFDARLSLQDSFIDPAPYADGGAYIYLSEEYYQKADKLGIELFREKPSWNNTRSTGWFIL